MATSEAEKEASRIRNKKYRENSKEKRSACLARYAAKNKERILEFKRDWKLRNPEKNSSINKNWIQNNPEKQRFYAKCFAKKYPHIVNSWHRARDARKINATPIWADSQKILELYFLAKTLSRETGIKHHVDHIIPLRGKIVCGLHVENNLRVITAHENHKKHARLIEELL